MSSLYYSSTSNRISTLPSGSSPMLSQESNVRILRPRRASPEQSIRPTRAEVNLAALKHNFHVLEQAAGHAQVWAVLKADAYGHGAPAVARTLERAGVQCIAVALLEEAIELRNAGIKCSILVMGGCYEQAYQELLEHRLTPVVYHQEHIKKLARAVEFYNHSQRTYKPLQVHLKIDTGMGRLGVTLNELDSILECTKTYSNIEIEGVMTHFACADVEGFSGSESMYDQLYRFQSALQKIQRYGYKPRFTHAANSAALFRSLREKFPIDLRFDAVRPGIALFGVTPCSDFMSPQFQLKPTLRLRSEIVSLRTLEPGLCVGYGSTWRSSRRSCIATIPMGYADGLPRSLSNQGVVLIHGRRAPIVGAISMDMCSIDVTDISAAQLHDEVVFLGEQKGLLGYDVISAEEIAKTANLIPWDVLTSISRRVPRFYI